MTRFPEIKSQRQIDREERLAQISDWIGALCLAIIFGAAMFAPLLLPVLVGE